MQSQFENDRDYYKLLGYIENEAGIENTDDYVSRMNAYVTLYAAIIQVSFVKPCYIDSLLYSAHLIKWIMYIYVFSTFLHRDKDVSSLFQAEIEGNSHGLKEGWTWCARFLNSLPADRLTASALEAFLKVYF